MSVTLPVLYSFRRCPYAMRARMALCVSAMRVILREVRLSQKPAEFVSLSPKATVPVLLLADGTVIDESIDIMLWALKRYDPEQWLDHSLCDDTRRLIEQNDNDFKVHLDHYKYFDRFPEKSQLDYRNMAQAFLLQLEELLQRNRFLLADRPTLVDVALMPFIRQFAGVEPEWFKHSHYSHLRQWLKTFTGSDFFSTVMTKYEFWNNAGDSDVHFPRQPFI